MDFLDNVKSVVGSAAQNVVKKSGEVVGFSKVKYAIYDTKGAIDDLYQRIGEAVYKSYAENTELDDSVRALCVRIQNLNDQLKAYEEQLASYKAVVKCGECGKSVKSECSYCPHCGAKLSVDADAEVSGGNTDASTEYYNYTPQSEPVDDEPDIAEQTTSQNDSNTSTEVGE